MGYLRKFIAVIQQGITQTVFPDVCLCCGKEALKNKRHVCDFCLHKRFEDANPENKRNSCEVILPNNVVIQHALWKFDKGGALQNLMHHLKYERLTAIGTQLGEVLGRRTKVHPAIQSFVKNEQTVLLPVPLHYLKFKKRGFNQAFYIARGIETIWHLPICPIDVAVRKKYTLSQTGFTLEKRIENMRNAFKVVKPQIIAGKVIIIVDDVFTTGATTFELAQALIESGAKKVMIWTVAQA